MMKYVRKSAPIHIIRSGGRTLVGRDRARLVRFPPAAIAPQLRIPVLDPMRIVTAAAWGAVVIFLLFVAASRLL